MRVDVEINKSDKLKAVSTPTCGGATMKVLPTLICGYPESTVLRNRSTFKQSLHLCDQRLRGNDAFPNPTARRMSPDVLEAGESVADKTAEMNQFVYDHIVNNQMDIADKIYGLKDITKNPDKAEWNEILKIYKKELITNEYIKIDTLSNLTG